MTKFDPSSIAGLHKNLKRNSDALPLLSKQSRRSALKQLAKAIVDNEEKIFAALNKDLKRPKFEAYVAEIALIKDEINYALKSLNAWSKKRVVKTPLVFQPGVSYVEPRPKGLVLIISPWNYPFQLSLVPLISAIAAGNCALVKPSELAPTCALLIADMINQYLDPDCFRAIMGDIDTAQALLDLPFDHIFYTGSTVVGIEVMKKAALSLTPVTLELGGKSPCIVDEHADIRLSAKRIVWGKCLNAGQTCIAPDYVLISHNIVDEFVKHAKDQLSLMFGNQPQSAESYGRIINEKHFLRLISYLSNGRIVHGGSYDQTSRYIEPTLLLDVNLDSSVMNEEIFGPILPIVPIRNIEEAIHFVKARPHPLALYIFSKNNRVIHQVLDQTLSGGVCVNDCITHVGIIDLPFGGVRHSGHGCYHGQAGFETFSHMRSVHRRANVLDNPIKYAPYSDTKLNLARLVMR